MAERAVLGSLLIDNEAIPELQALGLQPSDFYMGLHGDVFAVMCELTAQRRAVDFVTLCSALENKKNGKGQSCLEAIGGPATLTRLLTDTPTAMHAKYYAEIVCDLAYRRRLILAAAELARVSYEHEGTRDVLQHDLSKIFSDAVGIADKGSHLYGDDLLVDYLVNQVERKERLAKDPNYLITTPWPELNRALIELEPGALHVVAAPTGVGKTMYLECVAEHNARHGKAVAFYHLELSHQTMLDRRMARHSGIQVWQLRQGYDGKELHRATEFLSTWQQRMTYIHCPGWSAYRIVADLQGLHARGMADLAIVDYLGKLAMPALGGRTEASAIGDYRMEPLKICAEQLGIPIVTGSQLNRARRARRDKRAVLDDLRNSGEIAEKANQVVVIHQVDSRDSKVRVEHQNPIEIEFQIEKNSQGLVGIVIPMLSIPGEFKFVQRVREETMEETEEMEGFRF